MTHLNFCSVLAASPSRQQTASSFDRLHYGHLGDFADVSTGVADIFLRLSLVPDMYNVHRNKNIEEVAELPLITMVVNCHLWMTYGYATDSLFPLLGSQLVRSPEEKRKRLRKLYAITFAIWCVVSLYVVLGVSGVFGQTKSEVGTSLGYAGCPFSFSMFASPLATLKHVISTKSSASIPINMCTMILVSTAL
ncbi:hypothetical protein F443_20579 [Phytophthora nicotianae P1569]|uniref:Uncharacterized protein n=1 Tax=Phytophthora nicotianae P1569 TaxID=1317065 RepID=V9E0L2_PHYNI|nr:hypothetical protein F443_20579 [Phytophthora nicotianae P1569]